MLFCEQDILMRDSALSYIFDTFDIDHVFLLYPILRDLSLPLLKDRSDTQ